MATLDDLKSALAGGPLTHRAGSLIRLARPCIELRTVPIPLDDLDLGQSRIGGIPDIPEDMEWPRWRDEPQSFVAQFDLSTVRAIPAAAPLPLGGRLWFFYSARQDTWGFDPDDRGSWTVVHTPEGTPLRRTPPPRDTPHGGVFPSCRVTVSEGWTLPPWDSRYLEPLGLSDAEVDHYDAVLDAVTRDQGHQLLGHPAQIQSDMSLECALVTGGLNTGDETGWSDPRAEALMEGWSDWRLLLQVASDDATRMMWGDSGLLYFWIRDSDLEDHGFDQTWMILQSH